MHTEEIASKHNTFNYKPIKRVKALNQIGAFREKLKGGHINANDLTYGMVHKKTNIEHYLKHKFGPITAREDKKNGVRHNHEWVLGYFYMLEEIGSDGQEPQYGKIVFCVAPVLVLKRPHLLGAKFPGEIGVWDPADPNCPYPYTYGWNRPEAADDDEDDENGFYDMGEMWP